VPFEPTHTNFPANDEGESPEIHGMKLCAYFALQTFVVQMAF
jgi:hypothetical protein